MADASESRSARQLARLSGSDAPPATLPVHNVNGLRSSACRNADFAARRKWPSAGGAEVLAIVDSWDDGAHARQTRRLLSVEVRASAKSDVAAMVAVTTSRDGFTSMRRLQKRGRRVDDDGRPAFRGVRALWCSQKVAGTACRLKRSEAASASPPDHRSPNAPWSASRRVLFRQHSSLARQLRCVAGEVCRQFSTRLALALVTATALRCDCTSELSAAVCVPPRDRRRPRS